MNRMCGGVGGSSECLGMCGCVCLPITGEWYVGTRGSGEGSLVHVHSSRSGCHPFEPRARRLRHGPMIREYSHFHFCRRFDVFDKISAQYLEKFGRERSNIRIKFWAPPARISGLYQHAVCVKVQ